MPNRIRLLSEIVANQIAAGEVIDRPASVVKELVENALDAGATEVEVHTEGGGRNLILVQDNGWGMSADDALLSLERHATSKLRLAEDLRSIASYGFRGEALPSIASVSRFTLKSREPESVEGVEIQVNGGKIVRVQSCGCPVGTQIEVRSLFFNLPARRKFLRTESTEHSHVQHQLVLAGLSHPQVGFRWHHGGTTPERWPAGQTLERRCATLFGEAWARELLPIDAAEGGLRLTGFIGRAGVSRGNRHEQFLFVNRRPVENRTLNFALLEGYQNALMRGRYPVAVLFLELDPEGVDVNIHPAKREIKFHDDAGVRRFVTRVVRAALQGEVSAPLSVNLSLASHHGEAVNSPPSLQQRTVSPPPPPPAMTQRGESFASNQLGLETPAAGARLSRPVFAVPPVGEAQGAEGRLRQIQQSRLEQLAFRFVGIVARLYIVAESDKGMVLIDQHAAHERVMFEQLLKRLERQEIVSQRLLLPVSIDLMPRDAEFLRHQLPALARIGLDVSEFGRNHFLVDALPAPVRVRDVSQFLRDLVVALQEEGGETRTARRCSEEAVTKKACRLAVKANDPLSVEECHALLRDLARCDLPYTCPHGRPTMVLFSLSELEKRFGRVTG